MCSANYFGGECVWEVQVGFISCMASYSARVFIIQNIVTRYPEGHIQEVGHFSLLLLLLLLLFIIVDRDRDKKKKKEGVRREKTKKDNTNK
jgi:hypothetical protein